MVTPCDPYFVKTRRIFLCIASEVQLCTRTSYQRLFFWCVPPHWFYASAVTFMKRYQVNSVIPGVFVLLQRFTKIFIRWSIVSGNTKACQKLSTRVLTDSSHHIGHLAKCISSFVSRSSHRHFRARTREYSRWTVLHLTRFLKNLETAKFQLVVGLNGNPRNIPYFQALVVQFLFALIMSFSYMNPEYLPFLVHKASN